MSTKIENLEPSQQEPTVPTVQVQVPDTVTKPVQVHPESNAYFGLFSETNLILLLIVCVILYPGTSKMLSRIPYGRFIVNSEFFFIFQAIGVIVIYTLVFNYFRIPSEDTR